MIQILTIASHEIGRLRRRFSGGASPLTVVILLAALGLSALAFGKSASLGSGLYRVGVYGDVPPIQDERFAVQEAEPAGGSALLEVHAIDVYIDGPQVASREDDKSLYAMGAIRRYLEKQELIRIGQTYTETFAFPLRVAINYLDPATAGVLTEDALEAAATDKEIVIPSLMKPPAPFSQVIVALIYILPVTFISVFFTSSFMDEKINRRLTILMSTPVTPFQIIAGKMLPYAIFAMVTTALIAAITGGKVPLALLIFTPVILFIFAIYLMVPMFYRTFKDTTFISMLVTTLTTAYLVFPAMFTGISDLSYMSPLTLAVKMYRNEPFGWREYTFSSVPMAAIFGFAVYAATRMLNEEFLMGYRPLSRKIADAIFLIQDRAHPYLSILLFNMLGIPVVYMGQLVILIMATNLPAGFLLTTVLIVAALMEEVLKSIGVVVLYEQGVVHSTRQVLALSFLSALGFLIGEKLLVFFSISMVSESTLSGALLNTGFLLIPLLAHFFFTSCVTLLATKVRLRYTFALVAGALVHALYNWFLTVGMQ